MSLESRQVNFGSSAPQAARLLVIGHQADDNRALLEALRTERYDIALASNGIQGYGRAAAQLPDLILLGSRFQQPVDGFAACRLLKSDPATAAIPVIFLASSATPQDRLTGLREGAVDFILRPCEPKEVLERIRLHLRLAGGPSNARELRDANKQEERLADLHLVRAAVVHISANLTRYPGVAELARRVGTHSKRLTRAFMEHKGTTVAAFAREQRLAMARRLLVLTPLSVADIAADTGFSSAANLATAFKAHAGMSPMAYRRRGGPANVAQSTLPKMKREVLSD